MWVTLGLRYETRWALTGERSSLAGHLRQLTKDLAGFVGSQISVGGQWICSMELGNGQGHSFDPGEPAWLPLGRARRKKVFQVNACKELPHLVECECVAFFVLMGLQAPLPFSVLSLIPLTGVPFSVFVGV